MKKIDKDPTTGTGNGELGSGERERGKRGFADVKGQSWMNRGEI